jgi:Tfp pilus assembly protein PilF
VLSQIEALHFSPEIERLQGDLEKNSIGAQIEHVLLVYPNHHRALVSLSRLAQKTRGEHRKIHYFTVSCLFVRAVTFAPDDAVVRGVYGVHLSNFGRKKEALAQLLEAERLGAQDANTLYNIGLLYLESRDFDKSLDYAKRAYSAGFPLPGLRNRLQAAGKWQE